MLALLPCRAKRFRRTWQILLLTVARALREKGCGPIVPSEAAAQVKCPLTVVGGELPALREAPLHFAVFILDRERKEDEQLRGHLRGWAKSALVDRIEDREGVRSSRRRSFFRAHRVPASVSKPIHAWIRRRLEMESSRPSRFIRGPPVRPVCSRDDDPCRGCSPRRQAPRNPRTRAAIAAVRSRGPPIHGLLLQELGILLPNPLLHLRAQFPRQIGHLSRFLIGG